MDDALIDDDTLSPERKSLLPGEGFFIPDSIEPVHDDQDRRERVKTADVVAVVDPDADGLTCVALLRSVFDEVAVVPTNPHELGRGLETVAETIAEGTRVFVCDLNPDTRDELADSLRRLADRAAEIRWFDHHQWDDSLRSFVDEFGIDLVIGDSEAECTADVAFRELAFEFSDRDAELVSVVRDHDLWIRNDSRSDDLADYAHWIEPEEFIETVRAHGADLPAPALELLRERRVEKQALIDRAVRRAEFHTVGAVTVAVTYGRCSQNEVAEALRDSGADAVVVVKPAGSASIRGSDSFARCHEVARLVEGGGHPQAAGCKPDIYDDMLDFAHHWTTQGAVTKQVILDAFDRVITSDHGNPE